MTLEEANAKITERVNNFGIPSVCYSEFITGKGCDTWVTFRTKPRYDYNSDNMEITLTFECWLRPMGIVSVDEMREVSKQCGKVASLVEILNEDFSGEKIII